MTATDSIWIIRLVTTIPFAELAVKLAALGSVEGIRKEGRPHKRQHKREQVMNVLTPALRKRPDASVEDLIKTLTKAGVTTERGNVFKPQGLEYHIHLARAQLKNEQKGIRS
jgi:hypothetical protein